MAGLKIFLHTINKVSDSSAESLLIANYLKRIPWSITIQQLELKGKFPSDKQKSLEGDLLLKNVPTGNFIIALDENGGQYSSHDFSKYIHKIDRPISFIIGGAYGLSEEIKVKANLLLSLGKMTMPHVLARLILVEQLYRIYTIKENHPYHK